MPYEARSFPGSGLLNPPSVLVFLGFGAQQISSCFRIGIIRWCFLLHRMSGCDVRGVLMSAHFLVLVRNRGDANLRHPRWARPMSWWAMGAALASYSEARWQGNCGSDLEGTTRTVLLLAMINSKAKQV